MTHITRFAIAGILMILTGVACLSQPVLGVSQMPTSGDTFSLAIDQMPGTIRILSPGSNQRWDFTSLLAPYSRKYIWQQVGNSKAGVTYLNTQTESFSEARFQKTGGQLQLSRASGSDPLGMSTNARITYTPALTLRKFPLKYGDQAAYRSIMTVTSAVKDLSPSLLRKLPFQPDSLRLRVAIDRRTEVDAWGRLIIPGGIHDVLREKQRENRTIQVDARIGKRKWQNITSMLDIPALFPNPHALSYVFYSNTVLEPVATVAVDPISNAVLRVEFKAHELADIPSLTSNKPNIFAFPNPVIVSARFEFFNLPNGEYELSIYNLLGIPIIRKHYTITGNRTEKIDVSELSKGTYLYTLKDDRGNTITTKRLMVIRP